MPSDMETAFREFLLDPSFWRPRLERLARAPRELVLFPRPDLGPAGVEVTELRLRAHDGTRLRGLLARPSFRRCGGQVDLVAAEFLGADEVDWTRVAEDGASVLVYERVTGRRLEDRVLDVLRFAAAACEMETVDCEGLVFRAPAGTEPADEVRIAERIRDRGWIDGIS